MLILMVSQHWKQICLSLFVYQHATVGQNVYVSGTTYLNGVSGITPAMVSLGNVANTVPSYLPISTATQTAINAVNKTSLAFFNVPNTAPSYFGSAWSLASYAPLATPALTGMVTVDSTTKIFNFPNTTTLLNTGNIYSTNGLNLQGGNTTVMTIRDALISCNTNFI